MLGLLLLLVLLVLLLLQDHGGDVHSLRRRGHMQLLGLLLTLHLQVQKLLWLLLLELVVGCLELHVQLLLLLQHLRQLLLLLLGRLLLEDIGHVRWQELLLHSPEIHGASGREVVRHVCTYWQCRMIGTTTDRQIHHGPAPARVATGLVHLAATNGGRHLANAAAVALATASIEKHTTWRAAGSGGGCRRARGWWEGGGTTTAVARALRSHSLLKCLLVDKVAGGTCCSWEVVLQSSRTCTTCSIDVALIRSNIAASVLTAVATQEHGIVIRHRQGVVRGRVGHCRGQKRFEARCRK
mmetsp:Transcript_18855/g.40493  ORF Transcript_18855/g.40493 Transcript_18855/m.40493 type:complete len:297 (+) Transcript_18855:2990-3880(+)